jgi:hypothetical protein
MRIFRTKVFGRFARKADIEDDILRKAVAEVQRGLVDADLGGHVIKKRIARSGEGKSGGFRTIILFKAGERAFYVFGFSKSELGNIEDDELAAFKKLAAKLLAYSDEEISRAIETGALVEVT